MSVQIQSTKLRKFVTLHKTSAQGAEIFWERNWIFGTALRIALMNVSKQEASMKKWSIAAENMGLCKNISTFVKHNFENPIKMSHHIRFPPRQHFAWNGWTLYGSATTKGSCCHTKLNIRWSYGKIKSVQNIQQSAC